MFSLIHQQENVKKTKHKHDLFNCAFIVICHGSIIGSGQIMANSCLYPFSLLWSPTVYIMQVVIFTQWLIIIDVHGFWMKRWSYFCFFFLHFCLRSSLHLVLFPFSSSNTLPQSYLSFSISISSSQTLHWLISPPFLFIISSLSFCRRLSIPRAASFSPQSVWMLSPWWFTPQLNRRTCCSASNLPERKRLKAPGCERFAATSPTPSAGLTQWVATHIHSHTQKEST